ncbi:MAG: HEPN domain-containing protein [Chloroflexota bacterium]|nr:HEPN domain-containing protein [Chloroflexota bacterium]
MVCFHAQQAAEKSLRALLALHDVEYPWRHDLAELVDLAKSFAPQIRRLEERIILLTPFAVEVRYDGEFEPSFSEAVGALQTATEIHDLVAQIAR